MVPSPAGVKLGHWRQPAAIHDEGRATNAHMHRQAPATTKHMYTCGQAQQQAAVEPLPAYSTHFFQPLLLGVAPFWMCTPTELFQAFSVLHTRSYVTIDSTLQPVCSRLFFFNSTLLWTMQ